MQLCMFISNIGEVCRENNCEGNEEVKKKFKHQHFIQLCISCTSANNEIQTTLLFGGEKPCRALPNFDYLTFSQKCNNEIMVERA